VYLQEVGRGSKLLKRQRPRTDRGWQRHRSGFNLRSGIRLSL